MVQILKIYSINLLENDWKATIFVKLLLEIKDAMKMKEVYETFNLKFF